MDYELRKRLADVCHAIDRGEHVEYGDFEGRPTARFRNDETIITTMLQPGDREAIDAWVVERTALRREAAQLQADPPPPLTSSEVGQLREHGLAWFEGRFITDAQPPITEEEVRRISARLVAPIPEGLLALWRTSYGGGVCYDLDARFEGVDETVPWSFGDLLYPTSNHYHTLDGWMDHELELAQDVALERGGPVPDRLAYLPFAGFHTAPRTASEKPPGIHTYCEQAELALVNPERSAPENHGLACPFGAGGGVPLRDSSTSSGSTSTSEPTTTDRSWAGGRRCRPRGMAL